MDKKFLLEDISTSKLSLQQKESIVALYISVFSEPPRYEKIDATILMQELFSHNSLMTLLIQKKDGAIVGFIDTYPFEDFSDRDLLPVEAKKAGYISDFALSETLRGKGLGREVFRHHLQKLSEIYDVIYSRSRRDVKNIVHLFSSEGFSIELDYMVSTNGVRSHKNMYKKVLTC